ncbi:MAG: 23S rRNA (guanosine(2251)-2'-O)-methyltransferase RlmB [Thermodesulfobacteriota bacterium]
MKEQVIYGINPIREALLADQPKVYKIFLAAQKNNPALRELKELARRQNIPCRFYPPQILTKVAQTTHHQGAVAYQGAYAYVNLKDLWPKISGPEPNVLLLLDGIEDPQNFGSLLRTAAALGVTGVIIPKDRSVGVTPAVFKASAGAAWHVPVVRVTNLANTLEELKKAGFWIVGADPQGEVSLFHMVFPQKVALIIGSEGKGIRPLILKKCDYRVFIPLGGQISSLNAAVAGSIFLFEIRRQIMGPSKMKKEQE